MMTPSAADETAALFRLAGRDVAALFGGAPRFQARLEPDAALLLSGEPAIDLNMLLIGPSPRASAFLAEAVEVARASGLPMVALAAPQAADRLAPVAAGLGLEAAGTLPLMVLRADGPVPLGKPCEVSRITDPDGIARMADMVGAAFAIEPRHVGPVYAGAFHAAASGELYAGEMAGQAMSTVVATPAGDTAGIWCMATPPEHQGKGAGRALLTRVLETLRRRGVTRFYLFATPAGRPLYESLGFETLAECPAWALGAAGVAAH
jgi:GNAT superfamily N-acetyltransferase